MLSKFRVLDLCDNRGDFAGFLLAQMGAEVIAVEPTGGQSSRHIGPYADGVESSETSIPHWAYNRGKKSVVVSDPTELETLAFSADVLIECGVFEIDLNHLRELNPSLITVSLSPFGATGPKANWLGTDLTLSAAAGPMSLNGYKDRAPVRISAPQVWVNAASEAVCAVLIALTHQQSSGQGQHVDVSAQEAMMLTAQGWLSPSLCNNPPAQRSGGGLELLGKVKFRFVYESSDGHVTITFLPGVLVGPFTNRLVAWINSQGGLDDGLGDVDWSTLLDDYELDEVSELCNRTAACIANVLKKYSKAELFSLARSEKFLLMPVITPLDVVGSDHYEERQFWDEVHVDQIDRTVKFPGRWMHSSETGLKKLGPPPKLGEHTALILSEEPGPPRENQKNDVSKRPFEGLKILDFTWVYAGPFATRLFAYYGATVIRVESQTRPDQVRTSGLMRDMDNDGPENSHQWHSINADKLSLQLNLKVPETRQVVLDLVRECDVVINAFSPGVLERVGLASQDLLSVNPKLIIMSTTLFGHTGPLSPIPGFGNMGAAAGGYYELTGWADRLPAGPFHAYTDATSPRLTAAALMAALLQRKKTGKGQVLDFSQAEGGIHFLSEAVIDASINGTNQTRMGNADTRYAPHSAYACGPADSDQWIAIACENDSQWASLCELLKRPDLALLSVSERLNREIELNELISAWTKNQNPEFLQELLQTKLIPAHQVQNSPEVIRDPQLVHRDHFHQVPHEIYGHTWAEQYGFRLSKNDGTPRMAGPMWGEHNFEILTELLGYSSDQIAELAIAGVLE